MDQIKIGRFIASCRKSKGLTQAQLAEKLNLTDRAISKWETGKAMPDSSVMLELCEILGIRVNELLKGESIEMEKDNKANEELLLQMQREAEQHHKAMLHMEVILGGISTVGALALCFLAAFVVESKVLLGAIIAIAVLIFAVSVSACLKIEQVAGYYQCAACGHKYVPSYSSVFFAMHMGRTRYMKCPKCGKKSWNKKVLTKE